SFPGALRARRREAFRPKSHRGAGSAARSPPRRGSGWPARGGGGSRALGSGPAGVRAAAGGLFALALRERDEGGAITIDVGLPDAGMGALGTIVLAARGDSVALHEMISRHPFHDGLLLRVHRLTAWLLGLRRAHPDRKPKGSG